VLRGRNRKLKLEKETMEYLLITRSVIAALLLLILSACSQTIKKTQAERYLQDVEFIAQMPRTPGSEHHVKVQSMCAERFKTLGFKLEYHDYGTGINILGVYPGKQQSKGRILVSAHYDSVPGCNGADDNASGLAGVFETARLLVSKQHDRTLVVACWDEEERGRRGSKSYVEREKNTLAAIKMSYVYEMIAYKNKQPNSQKIPVGFEYLYPQQVKQIRSNQNRGDFIALVYDDRAGNMLSTITAKADKHNLSVLQFEISTQLKNSALAVDLRRSDHASFWDADYPAVMITDTANFRNPHYHCLNGEDEVGTIDTGFAIQTINVLTAIIEASLAE
jgi:Zn-dependent M28 family amino/carboxypeptidase